MLSGLMGADLRQNSKLFDLPITPASNFVIETSYEKDGTPYVEAFYNDIPF